ncbi:GntR family transcriptional regulator [Niallia sp. MER 6]|uniref:GntR family transcriptional regulator n=1 Tax=Niallia sp. MER 6 TaxID=2939567 RepID=UPI00203D5CCD|nr:GntR family transcriptional regulator [Niallia sp. MER 6]MCM3033542.1 GntR family transcriptional regulator [Niallia sp. MER 6]
MLKYQYIALEMERYITENALQQGDKLPIIETLISHYKVSKSTVIKALKLLEDKGIVFLVRGSGVFLRGQSRKGYFNLLPSQKFQQVDHNSSPALRKVVGMEIVSALPEVADALDLDKYSKVYSVKLVHYMEKQVLCTEQVFYNKEIISYLDKEIVSKSINNYLKDVLGLKIGFPDIYINLDKLNSEEASFFGLKLGDPMLCKEIIYHLTSGQPFCYSKAIYHYKQAKFVIKGNSFNSI